MNHRKLIPGLVVTFLVANDTWFFYQSASLNFVHRVLLVVIPFLLIGATPSLQISRLVRLILAGALMAFVWGAITTAFIGNTMQGPILLVQNFAPFLFLFAVANATRIQAIRLATMRAVFWMGAGAAIQTVTLFFLFLAHRVPGSRIIVLSGSRVLQEKSFGILGFANGILAAQSNLTVYRAQSWFGEPTGLALFLEASLAFGIVTLGSSKRRRIHKFGLVVTTVSLFLTFSTGMQFAAAATVAVVVIGSLAPRYDSMTRFLLASVVLVAGFSLVPPAIRVLNEMYQHRAGRVAEALGKSPVSSGTRFRVAQDTLGFIESHPQGTGFAPLAEVGPAHGQVTEQSGSAPFFWGLVLGVPGLVLALLFFLAILRVSTLTLPSRGAIRVLAVSLLAQTIHQFSAGSWTGGAFLLTIAIVGWELAYLSESGEAPHAARVASGHSISSRPERARSGVQLSRVPTALKHVT